MIAWPSTLPLPSLQYAGTPRNSVISSPVAFGTISKRSRFVKAYTQAQVSWILTNATLWESFLTFFTTDLGNGNSLFSIELKYPRNTSLEEWVVRFLGGYEMVYEDGAWVVYAELDLIRKATLAAQAALTDWSPFQVMSGESGGAVPEDFLVAGGAPFFTRNP